MSSDKPPQPPGKRPSGDGDPSSELEKQLDAVITRASSLADDLSNELGTCEAGESASSDALLNTATPTAQKVEQELKDLDHLVSRARAEVGAEAPAPDKPAAKPSVPTLEVPDFMAEFTQPQAPEELKPTRRTIAQSGAASQPKPPVPPVPPAGLTGVTAPKTGAAATGKLGVVGTPQRSPAGQAGLHPTQTMPAIPSGLHSAGEAKPGSLGNSPAQLVSAGLARATGAAVTVLELIDRPLKPVGNNARRLLGWIAIATIGAALAVLAGEWF